MDYALLDTYFFFSLLVAIMHFTVLLHKLNTLLGSTLSWIRQAVTFLPFPHPVLETAAYGYYYPLIALSLLMAALEVCYWTLSAELVSGTK